MVRKRLVMISQYLIQHGHLLEI